MRWRSFEGTPPRSDSEITGLDDPVQGKNLPRFRIAAVSELLWKEFG